MATKSDLTLNLVNTGTFELPRKSRKRFYGKNNFRVRKNCDRRKRKYGKQAYPVPEKPKILHTDRPPKAPLILESENPHLESGKSTALHFKSGKVDIDTLTEKKAKKRKIDRVKSGDKKMKAKKVPPEHQNINVEHKVTGKVIKSSLFNQNPEIPKVQQPELTSVEEKVFSKKRFSDLNVHPYLVSYLSEQLNMDNMTLIQQMAVPELLKYRDALIKSQTGSGKTLAYALPVMHGVVTIDPPITRKDGPVALVLVPTRELALQSFSLFEKLTRPFCRIVPTWLIGGESKKSEKSRIRKGINIVIGTPGRVLDHIQTTTSLSLETIRWLVFDEADRMLDMGFQKQVDSILEAVKNQSKHKKQTILVSATLSEKVERLATVALDNPVRVSSTEAGNDRSIPLTDGDEETYALPKTLLQYVAVVPSKLRLVTLVTFLICKQMEYSSCKILIFLSSRDSVEFHYLLLKHVMRQPRSQMTRLVPLDVELDADELAEFNIFQLHGGMTQKERKRVFNVFGSSQSGILLCTDVAARGLDIPFVDWVIQYTSPGSPIDYIHRVGRTARAGRKGQALLFLTPSEARYVSLLTQFNIKVNEMTVDDILHLVLDTKQKRNKAKPNQRLSNLVKENATMLQNQMESYTTKNSKMKSLAKHAFASFVRAYATYPKELKTIFHVKYLHLGHVVKSFALAEPPTDIVKDLHKSVGQLPINTSFEHREKKASEDTSKDKKETRRKTVGQKQTPKIKFVRQSDLISEYSSGL